MKIFEIIQYEDGGPNDRGKVIGYIKINEEEELPKTSTGFKQYHQISIREYNKRKNEALRALDLFTI